MIPATCMTLEGIRGCDARQAGTFREELYKNVEKRFSDLEGDLSCTIATFLDPRYMALAFNDSKVTSVAVEQAIITEGQMEPTAGPPKKRRQFAPHRQEEADEAHTASTDPRMAFIKRRQVEKHDEEDSANEEPHEIEKVLQRAAGRKLN